MAVIAKDNRQGFSLVELLIVITIIGTIATIAIPILMSTRDRAVDGKALNGLRTVVTAESAYYAVYGEYGDFAALEAGGFIDSRFDDNALGNAIDITTPPADGGQAYTCVIAGVIKTFSADESGEIREI